MVDFSKEKHLILLIMSFDIVDHVVFVRKLCLLALPANIFNWIDSFFITRSSSPGDDLVDWNSGVSVRPPSVRPSVGLRPYVHKKFFFRFRSNLVCG